MDDTTHGRASSSGHFIPTPRRTPIRLDRSSPIHSLLPYTCIALGGQLDGELDSFWRSVGFADLRFDALLERFATFLKRRVENGTLRLYFLPELLDFELTSHELRFMSRAPYLERGEPRERGVIVERGLGLALHPLVRVSRFPCDATALFESLARGDCLDCNVRAHESFLLISVLDGPHPRVIPVSSDLGHKLWALQCVGRFPGCEADVTVANALCAAPRPH